MEARPVVGHEDENGVVQASLRLHVPKELVEILISCLELTVPIMRQLYKINKQRLESVLQELVEILISSLELTVPIMRQLYKINKEGLESVLQELVQILISCLELTLPIM